MNNQRTRWIAITFLSLFFLWISFRVVMSSPQTLSYYPSTPIEPTIYAQVTPNWCGPGSQQSSIQWINQYNDGSPLITTVPMVPRATLWAYMRDNSCKDIGPGRDNFLQGNVWDGINDLRKLNIAYDAGVDPHPMAWTMWVSTGINHFYHYWVYKNGVDNATRWLLFTVERYHEPVIVAVQGGSHWVLVIGYQSDYPAYPGSPGNISQIRIADSLFGTKQWFPYQGETG